MATTPFILTREMLDADGITCPLCGHFYSSNGMGPQNNAKLTWGLQTVFFLSTRKFKFAAKAHDIAYLIANYMPVLYKDGQYQKLCTTRKDCDDLFSDLMHQAAEASYPWMRAYYHKGADLSYDFVRDGGESSFRHEH